MGHQCKRQYDELHEILHRGTTEDGEPLSREQRTQLKDILFLCHYGTPCGWRPPPNRDDRR